MGEHHLGSVRVLHGGRHRMRYQIQSAFSSRVLLRYLIWRDLKVRYRQTVVGVLWSVLQPLLLMLVFTAFFGHLAKVASSGVPYALFAYAGLVPWTLVSQAALIGAQSLLQDSSLVSKVYFPRILVPIASSLSYLLDALISTVLLLALMIIYGRTPTVEALAALPALVLAYLVAGAASTYLSGLNVRYRDVRYAVPVAIQVWLFLSPVVYPLSIVPARWRLLYACNPTALPIELYRWAFLHVPLPDLSQSLVGLASVALVFAGAVWYFGTVERTLADVI